MLARALVLAAIAWMAAIVLAPVAIDSGRALPSTTAALVYDAGARVCHQRPDRSFWIHGHPMPVCARCTGLYASATLAAPLALILAAGLSVRDARYLVTVAALPTLLTWGLEMAGLAHPSNSVRALAALPLGFAAAWLVIGGLTHGPLPIHEVRQGD